MSISQTQKSSNKKSPHHELITARLSSVTHRSRAPCTALWCVHDHQPPCSKPVTHRIRRCIVLGGTGITALLEFGCNILLCQASPVVMVVTYAYILSLHVWHPILIVKPLIPRQRLAAQIVQGVLISNHTQHIHSLLYHCQTQCQALCAICCFASLEWLCFA